MYTLFDLLTVLFKYKRLYEKSCCEIMKNYDLRITDLDVLYYFAHSGDRNLSKDVVDIGMSKANVSKAVDHLRQKELVFLKEDSDDRRCVHIEVAQAAIPIIEELRAIRLELGEKLLHGILPEEKESLLRVVRQIGGNINHELLRMRDEEKRV